MEAHSIFVDRIEVVLPLALPRQPSFVVPIVRARHGSLELSQDLAVVVLESLLAQHSDFRLVHHLMGHHRRVSELRRVSRLRQNLEVHRLFG